MKSRLFLLLLVSGLAATPNSARPAVQAQQPPSAYQAKEFQTTIANGFTVAAVGDLIMAGPPAVATDPGYDAAFDIIRKADVGYANMESSVIDLLKWKGLSVGPFVGPPETAAGVKAMGFDMVARSNNHIGEFGYEGLLETNAHLTAAGIMYAGSGENYWRARSPQFIATSKGKVGLISTTSSVPENMMAVPGRGEWIGRGGISALRVTPHWVVPAAMWDAVKTIRQAFPTGGPLRLYPPTGETENDIFILGQHFKKTDVDGPYWSYEMNQRDLEDIVSMVREGKVKSDFVAVAIHSHETRGAKGVSPELDPIPGDFLSKFAKASIDNGADAFYGTGVHVLRGIEIYKGRPIFYGLGEFFRQMDIVGPAAFGGTGQGGTHRGAENSNPLKYEGIIAVSRFDGGRLSEIRLYPTDLGENLRMAHRGVPKLAGEVVAQRTLKRLQELSAPYGTKITVEGNVGVIRVTAAETPSRQQ